MNSPVSEPRIWTRCALYLLFALLSTFHPRSTSAFDFAGAPGTYPHGLTASGTNLWHADYDTQRIYRLNENGEPTNFFMFTHGTPRGLAQTNGVLYVATSTRIYQIDAATGASITNFASPDPTSPNHQGLALGNGLLWVASRGDDDRIFGINSTNGLAITNFASPGPNPRGLTFHNGSLWNLDSSDDLLYQLSPTDGSVQGSFPIPLGNPRGLTYYDGRFLMGDYQVDLLFSFGVTNTFSDTYIAPQQFKPTGSSLSIPYISSQPLNETSSSIRRILFFQHGVDDNAVEYFARARYAATLAGNEEETLVATLQLLDDSKLVSAPPTNMLYWTSSRFWGGLSAGATAPYPRATQHTAYEILDEMLHQMTQSPKPVPES